MGINDRFDNRIDIKGTKFCLIEMIRSLRRSELLYLQIFIAHASCRCLILRTAYLLKRPEYCVRYGVGGTPSYLVRYFVFGYVLLARHAENDFGCL